MVNLLRFRAWHKTWEEMGKVKRIRFDDDGNVSKVLFMGKDFGVNSKIDEIELMQSTGLHDKNGKEIFEGDILKFNDEWADYGYEGYIEGSIEGINYVKIKREKTCFTFGKTKLPESSLINLTENEHYPFGELLTEASYEFEIIGNVYENPELLEVEE